MSSLTGSEPVKSNLIDHLWRIFSRTHWPLVAFALLLVGKQLFFVGQLGEALALGAERIVMSSMGSALILGSLALRRPGRRQLLLLALLDLGFTLFALGDVLHYRAFGDLPSVASLRYAGLLAPVAGAIVALIQPWDYGLIFLGPLVFALALFLPAAATRGLSRKTVWILGLAGVFLTVAVFASTPRISRLRHRGNAFLAGELGLMNFHLWEAGTYLGQRAVGLLPDPELEGRALDRFAALEREERQRSPLWGVAKGRSVIVLQLESFQDFAVGRTLEGQAVTPNLDALAAESLRFPEFFHQASKGRTSDAQFVVNCSLYPSSQGAVAFEYIANDYFCLPDALRQDGYETLFVQSFRPDFWNRANFNPKQGFSRSYSQRDFVMDEEVGYGLSDRSFFRQALEIFEEAPEPFYAFVLSLTSHTPFNFSNMPQTLELGGLKGSVVGSYLQSVHYTDGAVGEFMDALREKGILDEIVLVVYGDHDGLNRRSFPDFERFMPIHKDDELSWTREERGVPLLIRLPGGAHAGEQAAFGGQVDLAPTILGLLGMERDETLFLGRDLLAPATREGMVVFSDGSALGPDRLYAGGRCLGAEGELPEEACAAMARRAEDDLGISNGILENNSIPKLLQRLEARAVETAGVER